MYICLVDDALVEMWRRVIVAQPEVLDELARGEPGM
jgi:hypothetical protein